ncbi:hypothetical protein KIF59_10970 [Enterobacter cloacae subsp. cloacae]|nr:hypothetical protein [Enterobacter cloacae subsp. cloacae]
MCIHADHRNPDQRITKIDTSEVLNTSTFKSGMSACVCVRWVWHGSVIPS